MPDFKIPPAADEDGTDPSDADDPERITGLAVLRACILHARDCNDLLLIAGHTDTTGTDTDNLKLSKLRSDNVYYALIGDRDNWVDCCIAKHKVEDYQQILKWVARIWEWDCDPGPVDNVLGPNTQNAVLEFQRSYNSDFSAEIAEDGVVGKETWGAFFDVYQEVLKLTLETDEEGLAQMRGSLKFVNSGMPTVGCGENFPIEEPRKDNYRSAENRRVEMIFFSPDQPPLLDCHSSGDTCSPGACEIYKLHHFKFRHLPVPPIRLKTLRRWVIRVLSPGSGPPAKRGVLNNMEYTLTGSGGPAEIKGKTDAKGVLRVVVVDDPCVMTLKIAGLEFEISAGSLKKLSEGDEAAKQRLHNMAYGPLDAKSWDDDDFKSAINAFQKHHGLPQTGTVDGATRARLRKEHGS
jgi:peptidoglycan hydrolase-like protein with peptidoglycan-binding domain